MSNQGTSSVLLTADEHNAIRRAKKRSPRKSGAAAHTGLSLFEAVSNDRAEAREEARKLKKEAKELEFRTLHAATAKEILDKTDLTGFALKVASLVIDLFVTVTPTEGMKRTRTAETEMHTHFTDIEAKRTGAITKGTVAARRALNLAFDQLRPKNDRPVGLTRPRGIQAPSTPFGRKFASQP